MIGSFMQLLKTKFGERVDEAGLRYIDAAISSSKRMNELIQDLLQYARAGAENDSFTEVNTENVVLEILAQLDVVLEGKKAQINFTQLPVVWAQKTALEMLLRNLLTNAVKYQPKGNIPIVQISCVDTGSHWQFVVEDNGIGIAKEYWSSVFDLFKRLHGREEFSGTGMGLATCKKIVTVHNGAIWVESEEGKGSRFYFTIEKR